MGVFTFIRSGASRLENSSNIHLSAYVLNVLRQTLDIWQEEFGWISDRWFFVGGQGCSGQFSEVAGDDTLKIAISPESVSQVC